MPRASASSKRSSGTAPNTRDTRHENGLVGPGKRVASRRSQNQLLLDGAANGRSVPGPAGAAPGGGAPTAVAGAASAGAVGGLGKGESVASEGIGCAGANGTHHLQAQAAPGSPLPSPLPVVTNGKGHHHHHALAHHQHLDLNGARFPGEPLRRDSLGGYSEASSSESLHLTNGMAETGTRQIDVNATKNADVHRDSGPLELAATVLKALPLYDTLAILIVLMQVPPVVLSGIYMLFISLTYVRPVTTSSGMNINIAEILDWNSSMPSLISVVLMDGLVLLIWLFLWGPIQHAILDFAKPVIAVTLGGGSSSREGTSRSVTTCFLVVTATHLMRGTRFHWTRAARLLPPQWGLYSEADESLDAMSARFDKRGPHGWIKSLLAIHILTQGIVRYIREWYLRREKANAAGHGLGDPEAGKLPSLGGDVPETGFATPDTDASFPVPALSTKKKRKQSTQVRLQQPLWAALASTKIVVMKEYELSKSAEEWAGTNATDIHNLGNAPFEKQPAQIWISYVGSDEVCFGTSHFDTTEPSSEFNTIVEDEVTSPGTEMMAPFYVKVNSAVWQPTRIYRVAGDADDHDEPDEAAEANGSATNDNITPVREHHDAHEFEADINRGARWSGDIYGLRPLSNYNLEFVDVHTHEVIFTTKIRTMPAPSTTSSDATKPVQNGRTSRPDSPSTTMKNTIAVAEGKLAEEKERLRKMRKDAKGKLNSLRREIERLDNQLQSAGSNDDKLRQKVQQHEAQRAQAAKEMDQIEAQIQELDGAPEGLTAAKKETERRYAAEKALYEEAEKRFAEHRAALDTQVKSKADEQAAIQTRRDKIASRISKVDGDLERITDANNRGLNEAERRRQETTTFQANATKIEGELTDRLGSLRAENESRQDKVRELMRQLNQLHEQQFLYAMRGMAPPTSFADGYHSSAPSNQSPQSLFPNPLNNSTYSLNPAATPYQQHVASASPWPNSTTAPGPSQSVPAIAPPGPPYGVPWLPSQSSTSLPPLHSHGNINHGIIGAGPGPGGFKARGRSSSMLSEVSGFTQSSGGGEDDNSNGNANGYFASPNVSTPALTGTVRGPPGLLFSRQRQRSDGGSGSGRSSVRSGSGSGSSVRDPTSPT